MNNVYKCIGKYANNPFYIKFSEIYLYSIEELCYYLIERSYVTDESMMSLELVDWIRQECGLEELAKELEGYLFRHVSFPTFAVTILERIGIYDGNTIREVEKELKEYYECSSTEKWMKRAHNLVDVGKYQKAMKIYFGLLEELPREDEKNRAKVLYQIATIFALNFVFHQAADYYAQSFRLHSTRKTKISYLLANRMAMNDFEYGAFTREHPNWKEDFLLVEEMRQRAIVKWEESGQLVKITQINMRKEAGELGAYYLEQGEFIQELKEEYRKQCD